MMTGTKIMKIVAEIVMRTTSYIRNTQGIHKDHEMIPLKGTFQTNTMSFFRRLLLIISGILYVGVELSPLIPNDSAIPFNSPPKIALDSAISPAGYREIVD